jgi:hypothetical protein
MGKKKQTAVEDLLIPPQDNRICGTICVCQMTLILSCVALVYLTGECASVVVVDVDLGVNFEI